MTHKPTQRELADRILSSLDDEEFDAADVADALGGVDLKAIANEVRSTIADADRARNRAKLADADAVRARDLAAFRGRPPERRRSKAELQMTLRDLARRAGPEMVAQYQMKFEEASEEDLVQMIAEIKHLLGEE